MEISMNSTQAICGRCGKMYGSRRGNFPVSYSVLNKGVGYLHICKKCVDELFEGYLSRCHDPKDAVRQVCRKLDLFWSESLYERAEAQSSTHSLMSRYLSKLTNKTYAGKCYDDTLSAEGTLWTFNFRRTLLAEREKENEESEEDGETNETKEIKIPKKVRDFWGPGYSPEMYKALEQRRSYWMSRFPDDMEIDIGTEAIIRQLCSLELDINRDRAEGKSVDKNVNTLNTLLGSAMLKPTQKKDDADTALQNTPMGVWLQRYEQEKPLPEVEDKLKRNKILKYIFTWMGHLCKMLGIKNGYTKMYEEEVERLRVERPEYDDEDEEDLLIDSYSEGAEDPDGDDL